MVVPVVVVVALVGVGVVDNVEGLSSLALAVMTVSIGWISSNAFMNAGRTGEPEEGVVVEVEDRDEGLEEDDEDDDEEGEGVEANWLGIKVVPPFLRLLDLFSVRSVVVVVVDSVVVDSGAGILSNTATSAAGSVVVEVVVEGVVSCCCCSWIDSLFVCL